MLMSNFTVQQNNICPSSPAGVWFIGFVACICKKYKQMEASMSEDFQL